MYERRLCLCKTFGFGWILCRSQAPSSVRSLKRVHSARKYQRTDRAVAQSIECEQAKPGRAPEERDQERREKSDWKRPLPQVCA